jgi:hypothetical protein
MYTKDREEGCGCCVEIFRRHPPPVGQCLLYFRRGGSSVSSQMCHSCCWRLDGQKASNLPTTYNNSSEIQLMTCNDGRQVTHHGTRTQLTTSNLRCARCIPSVPVPEKFAVGAFGAAGVRVEQMTLLDRVGECAPVAGIMASSPTNNTSRTVFGSNLKRKNC